MVKETGLYDLLDIKPNAKEAQIKKAYRKQAMLYHPDRNPDADQDRFKEITRAYEILTDEEQRSLYDDYGEDGLKEGGPGGGDDIFSSFFGGGFGGRGGRGGRGRKKRKEKGESVQHGIVVSLEDLFNGKTIKLGVTKDAICPSCDGKGSANPDAVQTCGACRGQGMTIQMRQIAPGMMQQVQARCSTCGGRGEVIQDRYRCQGCAGRKVVQQKKVLEVHVDKGMSNGQKITFKEESDQGPDHTPGDIIIVLQVRKHEFFKREGSHLYVEETISLKEALCGFERDVRHFNGRRLKVRCEAGELVINPGDIKKVENEGMPVHKRPYMRGHLYVKFNVKFPTVRQLDARSLAGLKELLPGSNLPASTGESVSLKPFDPHEVDPSSRVDKDATQDDDEREGHGGQGGVQCAQQ